MVKKKKEARGGARQGAGRKSAEQLGVEKKERYVIYLYPSVQTKVAKKFGSLTIALESLT